MNFRGRRILENHLFWREITSSSDKLQVLTKMSSAVFATPREDTQFYHGDNVFILFLVFLLPLSRLLARPFPPLSKYKSRLVSCHSSCLGLLPLLFSGWAHKFWLLSPPFSHGCLTLLSFVSPPSENCAQTLRLFPPPLTSSSHPATVFRSSDCSSGQFSFRYSKPSDCTTAASNDTSKTNKTLRKAYI